MPWPRCLGLPGFITRITGPHRHQVVTNLADMRGIETRLLSLQCSKCSVSVSEQRQVVQGDIGRRYQLYLATTVLA